MRLFSVVFAVALATRLVAAARVLLLDRDGTAPEGVESIPSLDALAGRLDGAARPGLCP